MANKILVYITFALIVVQISIVNNQNLCSQRNRIKIDKQITRLLVVGQKDRKFPTNEQQLRPYCNNALKTFEDITRFSDKCLPKFGRDSAKVIMHGIGVELKGVCKSGKLSKRAKELLNAAPCGNAGLDNWQRCNLALIEKFTGILNAPLKRRLPMACCNFHQLVRCLTEEAEEVKQCTKKTIDFVVNYVHKIIDPIILIVCGEYGEPSDRCDKLVKLTPNRTDSQPKHKSFLIPVIDISVSLGDDIFS